MRDEALRLWRWLCAPTRVPRGLVYYAIAVAFIGLPRGVSNWVAWLWR